MEFLLYINAVFSVFAYGTYPVRPFLFVAFLLLLVGVFFAARRGYEIHFRFVHAAKIVALTSVALLFTMNLIASFAIFRAHAIPAGTLAVFLDESNQTALMITHSHVGKVIMGAPARQFVSGPPLSADTGAALVPAVPAWLPPVEAFLFLAALLSSLAAFPELLSQRHGRARGWFFLLYGLTVFIVFDKVIDGGILNDAAFLATAAFGAMFFAPPRRFLVWLWWGVIANAWIIAGVYLSGAYQSGAVLLTSVERVCIFAGLACALHFLTIDGRRRIGAALLVLVFIACGIKAYPDVVALHNYLATPIDPIRSYAASYEPLPGLTRVANVGKLGMYDLHPLAGVSFGVFFARDNLAVWRIPVSHDGVLCTRPPYIVHIYFTLLAPEAPATLSYQVPAIGDISLVPSGTDPSGWNTYKGIVTLNPCAPERYAMLREFILGTGIPSAVIYGLANDRYPVTPMLQ